jgi:hypothetical protein
MILTTARGVRSLLSGLMPFLKLWGDYAIIQVFLAYIRSYLPGNLSALG